MGWRANFYVIAFLATLSCFATWFCIKETLPVAKRNSFTPLTVLKNYCSLIANVPFMSHTLIWCFGFSIIVVFIANLSLIFIDYLQVPKEVFGYYQSAIMGAYFLGSMGGSYLLKKIGMGTTRIIGDIAYFGGIVFLLELTFAHTNSPLMFIIAMSLVSLGQALAGPVYFTYSMTYIDEMLKGSAMSLIQPLRFSITSAFVGIAASVFDGTTRPMSLLAIISAVVCLGLYVLSFGLTANRSMISLPGSVR